MANSYKVLRHDKEIEMNDGSLIKTSSLPSTHPWASEGFHCIRRAPSQREYECKSKCLDATEGPLFIESIIICRLGTERLELLQGIDMHEVVYMLL